MNTNAELIKAARSTKAARWWIDPEDWPADKLEAAQAIQALCAALEAAEAARDAALAVIAKARGSWGLQALCDGELEPEDGWRVASYVIEALSGAAK